MKVSYRVALGSVLSVLTALSMVAPAFAAPAAVAAPGASAGIADSADPSTPVSAPASSPAPSTSGIAGSPSPQPSAAPSTAAFPPSASASAGPSDSPTPTPTPTPTPGPTATGIAGTLSSSAGAPLANTSVTAINRDTWQNIFGWTDAGGHYAFSGLNAGSYWVSFEIPGTLLTQYVPQQTALFNATAYQVQVGAVTTVNDTALPVGRITGHFTDRRGNPLAANVQASQSDTGLSEFTSTDSTGAYTMAVFAGTYTVGFTYDNGVQQYAYQQAPTATPTRFSVAGDATVVVDDSALPAGSIAGVLTDVDGSPLSGGQISLTGTTNGQYVSATTAADGSYHIDVPTGTYTMRIATADGLRYQWVNHTTNWVQEQVLTVTADQVTTVNDVMVATGTIVIRLVDDGTGQALTGACAYLSDGGTDQYVCADGTGAITITGAPAGNTYDLYASADGRVTVNRHGVAVVADQTSTLTIPMARSATITTTVVDAATGRPVPHVCVWPLKSPDLTPAEGPDTCSDNTGAITFSELEAGTYTLFAWPDDGVHGAQWVGTSHGAGNADAAAQITVAPGATVVAPTIRLDPAGSISGKVTDAHTGAPLRVAVSVVPVSATFDRVGFLLGTNSDPTTGRYTLTGIGPYNWPVEFATSDSGQGTPGSPHKGAGHAWQWSGGALDRRHATPVHVTVGCTATANARLSVGTVVSGRVVDSTGAPVGAGSVTITNSSTGDPASGGIELAPDGTFFADIAPGQSVLVSVASPPVWTQYWYPGTTNIRTATAVRIGARPLTLTITEPAS